jgi:protein gp37
MGEKTGIAWADHTFNPWWGCMKVSPGCVHCYAETLAHRYGHEVWGPDGVRRFFGDRHWAEPMAWWRRAVKDGVRRRVFCGSMCDVFEDLPGLYGQRARLFELIEATPDLDWLLLTKRPENIVGMTPGDFGNWPNVWIGTSVEDQRRADVRVPHLLRVPAAIHFLSIEPLLGPIDLWRVNEADVASPSVCEIDWAIIGGESGPLARPMDLAWARTLLGQCREAGIVPFVKQLGGHPSKREHPEDWPEDLRVQEFPRQSSRRPRPADVVSC